MLYRAERYDSLNCILEALRREFAGLGITVDQYRTQDNSTDVPSDLIPLLEHNSYDAVLVMNAVGQENYEYKGRNLWEHFGIPFCNYIVDHPVDHQRELKSPCACQHVFCMDPDHEDFIRTYFPNIASVHTIPLAGMNPDPATPVPDFDRRDMDILFTGSLESLGKMEQDLSGYPPHLQKLIVSLIEHMLDHRSETYEQALSHILGSVGLKDLPKEEYLSYAVLCRIALRYVRAYFREEVIRHLACAGLPLHLFGMIDPALAQDLPSSTVRIYPPVSFLQCAELNRRAKLVLNVMPLFKKGSHDRIPTALLNGAVPVTDHSEFFDREIWKDKLILYDISHPETLPHVLGDILSDPDRLRMLVENGHRYGISHLTWEQTAKEILSTL